MTIQQSYPFRRRTRVSKAGSRWIASKPIIQRNRLRGLCRRHGIICSTCFSPNLCKICKRPLRRGRRTNLPEMPMRPAAHGISSTGEQPRRATFYSGKNRIYNMPPLIYDTRKAGKSTKPDPPRSNTMIIKGLGHLLRTWEIARELQADHSIDMYHLDTPYPPAFPCIPAKKRQRGTTQSGNGIYSGIRSIWRYPHRYAKV